MARGVVVEWTPDVEFRSSTPGECECHGISVLTNDDGTWEATYTGTTTWSETEPAHVHHVDLVFIGTGDYDGLRFVAEMDGTDYLWAVAGEVESTG